MRIRRLRSGDGEQRKRERTVNTKLLRRVAKHISEEPKRLAMGSFIQTKDETTAKFTEHYHRDKLRNFGTEPTEHNFAPCGTAACIAGWATILGKGDTDMPNSEGERLLDIDAYEAGRLFYVDSWPKQFEKPYMEAMTPAKRARIAVARIEHFIKTKGAE